MNTNGRSPRWQAASRPKAVSVFSEAPSGGPAPSPADIDMTRQIVQAAKGLPIAVRHYLVVRREGAASFKPWA
ncbi:MAG: RadC-like domain [Caulobacteraceae bacterium]|nr:RadC-like domain [Caulobacteraceae bacterium]